MSYTKDCSIVVLDVRSCAEEEFRQKSIKCIEELFKHEICTGKKHYVSFVLLGTKETLNYVNQEVFHDGYTHITQYPHVQLPTWQMLTDFFKFVNEETCCSGEWLDALVVAMEMLKTNREVFKYTRQRILFFYEFDDCKNNYEMFDVISDNMRRVGIQLVLVANNVRYVDNPASGKPEAIFDSQAPRSHIQLQNEKYALRLIENCGGRLCNLLEAPRAIKKRKNIRPYLWSSTFSIGNRIKIQVSSTIVVKNRNNVKLKKVWGQEDEVVTRELKHAVHGTEIEPLAADLIDGYMLGATPIPYDESLNEDKVRNDPGLKFICFAKQKAVPDEYFMGDSTYKIMPQKNCDASAKIMNALVRALIDTEMVVLCWKIYSRQLNTPKFVVLLPDEIRLGKQCTMTLIHLSYYAQHHFWNYLSLNTTKTECTTEQIDAIDNLIDAMDLTLPPKVADKPRETFHKDVLPFDMLPDIYQQNFIDILERKVLCNASETDEQFLDMLSDKNFVEVFWKLPEQIEEEAKRAVKKVRDLFPLERITPSQGAPDSGTAVNPASEPRVFKDSELVSQLSFDRVRSSTPADDFEQLIKHNVLPLKDKTVRRVRFDAYASQMRSQIWELFFGVVQTRKDSDRIVDALKAYRANVFQFNAFADYNTWIRELAAEVKDRKMQEQWKEIVVQHDLGLCIVGEEVLDEKVDVDQFYAVMDDATRTETDELTQKQVDNLIANM